MSGTDLAATRAFFGPRAAGWENRFPDDGPVYAAAFAELAPPVGRTALDAACGTGRALPAVRDHVGGTGTVIAVDVTVEMLAEATRRGRGAVAALLLADVARPGGRLAVFHPIGRADLAHRHGNELQPDDIRAEPATRRGPGPRRVAVRIRRRQRAVLAQRRRSAAPGRRRCGLELLVLRVGHREEVPGEPGSRA